MEALKFILGTVIGGMAGGLLGWFLADWHKKKHDKCGGYFHYIGAC